MLFIMSGEPLAVNNKEQQQNYALQHGTAQCHGWRPILHEVTAQCVATGAAEVSSKRRRTDIKTDTATAGPPDDQPNDVAATGTDGVARYACKGYQHF